MELKNLRKFILIFGMVVLILVVMAFISVNNYSRVLSITLDLTSRQEVVQAAGKIQEAIEDEKRVINEYRLSGNEELLPERDVERVKFDDNWAVIVRERGEEQAQLIADIEGAHKTYIGLLDQAITEYQSDPDNNNSAGTMGEAINYYLQNVDPKFSDLYEPELIQLSELVDQESEKANRQYVYSRIVLVLSTLVGLGVIVVVTVAIMFSRRMLDSMTAIVDAANAISRGDLDVPIDVEQGGEMGDLAQAIDRMRVSLKAAIERLRR